AISSTSSEAISSTSSEAMPPNTVPVSLVTSVIFTGTPFLVESDDSSMSAGGTTGVVIGTLAAVSILVAAVTVGVVVYFKRFRSVELNKV
ncbi:hypothetical protein, partial [Endozoicomonas sp. ONNA1]|uniref:hypothetical protein n=1 Tax=Endozoicomonas sp. ONNA1 TaxID=2828740 RepID=UPI0021482823